MSSISAKSILFSALFAVVLWIFPCSVSAGGGAIMSLKPVSSVGPSVIIDNKITLDAANLPQRVTFEVWVSDWAPQQLGTYQADVQCITFNSGAGADLTPASQSCTTSSNCAAAFGPGAECSGNQCKPAFISIGRADYLFAAPCTGFGGVVDVSCSPALRVADFSFSGCSDPLVPRYGGSFVLDIPMEAAGTYTLDLASTSLMVDQNNQGIPFERRAATVVIAGPPTPQGNPDPNAAPGTRTVGLYFAPPNSAAAVNPFAIRVTLSSLHHPNPPYAADAASDFSAFEGERRWVGPPSQFVESSADATTFTASTLQCTPHYLDWTAIGLIFVYGREIVPSSTLTVETLGSSCQGNEDTCTSVSDPFVIVTSRWADVQAPFNPPDASAQPDFGDISALVNKFRSGPGALSKVQTKLQPNIPNMNSDVDFSDISECVNAFRGKGYPFAGPLSCP